jgi:hypothetical protein
VSLPAGSVMCKEVMFVPKHGNKGQRVRDWERLHGDDEERPVSVREAQAVLDNQREARKSDQVQ